MKIGDFVFADYDNGEIVNGEVVNVRTFGDRILLTVKCEQGYRSIYVDKCVTFDCWSEDESMRQARTDNATMTMDEYNSLPAYKG